MDARSAATSHDNADTGSDETDGLDQMADGGTGSVGDRSQVEVEQHLADDGFDAEFGARPDAAVLCFTCHREFPADQLCADDARRVEGESDPSDMAIVVPVTCPHCGAAGVLSLQFGPMAGAEESEVIASMSRTAAAFDARPSAS